MNEGFWNYASGRAQLACGALEATLDPRRPGQGLDNVVILRRALAGAALLGVELPDAATEPPAIVDVYARGTDLVATYAATDSWPFGAQIYWRVWIPEQAAVLAAVELIVSVQTQLLDTRPRLLAATRFPPCDLFRLTSAERGSFAAARQGERNGPAEGRTDDPMRGPADQPPRQADARPASDADVWRSPCDCTMLRPAAVGWTYGEIVHPSGPADTILDSDSPAETRVRHPLFAERLEKGVILRARVLAALVERPQERLQLAALYREYAASAPPLTV